MNEIVEVEYSPSGEAYLVLRKLLPEFPPAPQRGNDNSSKGVVIIDMYEEDKICYEC